MLELKKGKFVVSYIDKETDRKYTRKFDTMQGSLMHLREIHDQKKFTEIGVSRESNVDHLRHKITDMQIDYVAGVAIKTYYDKDNVILYCEKCDDGLE